MLALTEKITARHRDLGAYVYVRQSTPRQVQHNRESQQNQYALMQRALALGWVPERVAVIDADLGQSGQDGGRRGFQELVAEVSLGHVGLILAYEASRLARNNADWYRLLDLAAVVGTLLADADGVYDPRLYNDRMLLGMRGILSEAELHLLQLRLQAGRMRQVERGAYRQNLPTGLVRLGDGQVVKDPNERIQHTIALVFERFAALGSCRKVLRSFRRDDLLLPRVQTSGIDVGQVFWRKPTEAALHGILRNPAYAGAFVFGRRAGRRAPDGRMNRSIRLAPEEWTAIRHDVYPAYVTWEQFVAIQDRLTDNASRYARNARGAPRGGPALLTGLVVCGRCGHQMRVTYKAHPRYICPALPSVYGESSCLSVDHASVDAAVVEAFFAALRPAELDLLEETLAAQRADHARLARQCRDRVAHAEYQARLAERQYQAVDPDNRLVAAELERRWEVALRACAEAREAEERFARTPDAPALDPTLRAQLHDLGPQLPALWASGRLSASQKKELLRSLIRWVILLRPVADTVEAKVVWVSGAFSPLNIHPAVHRGADLGNYEQLVERSLELGHEGYPDAEIARRLTAEGFRSARSGDIPATFVERVRRLHGQVSRTEQFRRAEKIDGYWTVWGLARHLDVESDWLRKRLSEGALQGIRDPATGRHLIVDNPEAISQVRAKISARSRH